MSTELLASKVVNQEEDPAVRVIAGVPTSRLGIVGVTERGPFGGKLITSPLEYRRYFGGYTGSGEVAQAVDGFFLNGGRECVISRVVHFSDATDPETATSAVGTVSLNNSAGTPVPSLRIDGASNGTYANALAVRVADASDGDAAAFNLFVMRAGIIVERFPSVSMDDTSERYVEAVVNDPEAGSSLVRVTDLDAAGDAAAQRPANVLSTSLTGGDDGLTGLADADFVGGTSDGGRVGIRVLDVFPEVSLLIVPGRATAVVQNAMVAYCEVTRNKEVFPILGPPAGSSATGMVTYVESTAALLNLSEFGAMYWPRVEVANPSKAVFGNGARITVSPDGYVAGVYARTDGAREGGVYDPPAGIEKGVLFGVLGFETDECLDEAKRDIVYPKRINPLTTAPGLPRYIDGTRTLKGNGNFPSVAERRGVIFIQQSIKRGIQFARHKNNDEALRAEVERTVESFLGVQMALKAFRSKDPKTAFFVDFDVPGVSLNTPAVVFANKLVGRVGLATQKPADFVIVSYSQDTRAFNEAAAA